MNKIIIFSMIATVALSGSYNVSDRCLSAMKQTNKYLMKANYERSPRVKKMYIDYAINSKINMMSDCNRQIFLDNGRYLQQELDELNEVRNRL